MYITVIMYYVLGMGLNNHILWNLSGIVFQHILHWRWREEHQSQYKEIYLDLIESSQNTETD